MTNQTHTDPRIYAACLASYNNGSLHGAWIDCDGLDADQLHGEINKMLKTSRFPNVVRRQCNACDHIQDDRGADDACDICCGELSAAFRSAEEWAIHDHEGFEGMLKSEYTSMKEIAAMAEGLLGDHSAGFVWLVEDFSMKPSEAIDKAGDVQIHSFDRWMSRENKLGDYAQSFYEDSGGLPDNLPEEIAQNIDWNGIGRDWELNGAISLCTIGGEEVLIANPQEF
jgi:antirestriction protein